MKIFAAQTRQASFVVRSGQSRCLLLNQPYVDRPGYWFNLRNISNYFKSDQNKLTDF